VACRTEGRRLRARLEDKRARQQKLPARTLESTHKYNPLVLLCRRSGPAPQISENPSTPHLLLASRTKSGRFLWISQFRSNCCHPHPASRKAVPQMSAHCKPADPKKTTDNNIRFRAGSFIRFRAGAFAGIDSLVLRYRPPTIKARRPASCQPFFFHSATTMLFCRDPPSAGRGKKPSHKRRGPRHHLTSSTCCQ
jgi:hypothetical protein